MFISPKSFLSHFSMTIPSWTIYPRSVFIRPSDIGTGNLSVIFGVKWCVTSCFLVQAGYTFGPTYISWLNHPAQQISLCTQSLPYLCYLFSLRFKVASYCRGVRCFEQSYTEKISLCFHIFVFSCQYHSINGPYSCHSSIIDGIPNLSR